MRWQSQASCKGRTSEFVPSVKYEVESFDPTNSRSLVGVRPGRVATAKIQALRNVCETCPVRTQCLNEALRIPDWSCGTWAGRSQNDIIMLSQRLGEIIAMTKSTALSQLERLIESNPDLLPDPLYERALLSDAEDMARLVRKLDLSILTMVVLAIKGDRSIHSAMRQYHEIPCWIDTALHRNAPKERISQKATREVVAS